MFKRIDVSQRRFQQWGHEQHAHLTGKAFGGDACPCNGGVAKRSAPGPEQGDVRLSLRSQAALLALSQGQIGTLASAVVEGWVDLQGSMRDIMAAASALLHSDPVGSTAPRWSTQLVERMRSMALHTLERDAMQVQYHYDLSDAFYALWLDPLRVYSCAYYREPDMTLAQAQEAKLDHICRKLRLQAGERLLDIGCGWGGLIVWAAKHYGVKA